MRKKESFGGKEIVFLKKKHVWGLLGSSSRGNCFLSVYELLEKFLSDFFQVSLISGKKNLEQATKGAAEKGGEGAVGV